MQSTTKQNGAMQYIPAMAQHHLTPEQTGTVAARLLQMHQMGTSTIEGFVAELTPVQLAILKETINLAQTRTSPEILARRQSCCEPSPSPATDAVGTCGYQGPRKNEVGQDAELHRASVPRRDPGVRRFK